MGLIYSGQSWYRNIQTRYCTSGYTQDERLKQYQVLSSIKLPSRIISINYLKSIKFNKTQASAILFFRNSTAILTRLSCEQASIKKLGTYGCTPRMTFAAITLPRKETSFRVLWTGQRKFAFHKTREFFEYMGDYLLLKQGSAPLGSGTWNLRNFHYRY
jgi:hypothetical protein